MEDETGLYYYNARYYDPEIGQFVSPDALVPDSSKLLAYNRFMYAYGNPLKYNDPTGHYSIDELLTYLGVETYDEMMALFDEEGAYEGLHRWYDILRLACDGGSISVWPTKVALHQCLNGITLAAGVSTPSCTR